MIQLKYFGSNNVETADFYINLYSKGADLPDSFDSPFFPPLIVLTSQQTGKEISVLPFAFYFTDNERYTRILIANGVDAPTSGFIIIGNTDYPLGFYDVNIYLNSSATNLDPTGRNLLWNGLLNFYGDIKTTAPNAGDYNTIQYTQYTDNDSDTNSVYITN